jgi:hypothetical protein
MRAHGSPPTQEVFRFDAIMDVRVAAVGPTQTSWRSRRPVRHERFNSARACELRTTRPVKEFRCR